jgi:pyrroloquinoline quinone biosynthesis protein B
LFNAYCIFERNLALKKHILYLSIVLIFSCADKPSTQKHTAENTGQNLQANSTYLVILGTVQDAGSPQIGCEKDCCKNLFANPDSDRQVVSLGLLDTENNKKYLFEATPDIARQLKTLKNHSTSNTPALINGIFLTHAHMGHYTGLMYLGKESMSAKNVTVFAMPRMKTYLETNGPWDQLVANQNIALKMIKNEESIPLTPNIQVTPLLVPHRDEYSETVGYRITGPNKSALFIPDIDKWDKWNKNILDEIKKVDYAFLDATFYSGAEINNRDISQIPHPFIIESMEKFAELSKEEKNKIIFIHFNHTNPVLNPDSKESEALLKLGYRIGRMDDRFKL